MTSYVDGNLSVAKARDEEEAMLPEEGPVEPRKRKEVVLDMIGMCLLAVSAILWWPGINENIVTYKYNLPARELPKIVRTFFPSTNGYMTVINETRALVMPPNGIAYSSYVDGDNAVAAVIIFFGVVIPLTKFTLFGVYVTFRMMGVQNAWSRGASMLAQKISKWAAVDSMIEALIVGALMMVTNMQAYHEVGFVCFTGYVLVSSFAFMIIMRNEPPANLESAQHLREKVGKALGETGGTFLSLGLFLTLLIVLYQGITLLSFRVWLTSQGVKDSIGEQVGKSAGSASKYVFFSMLKGLKIDVNLSISEATLTLLSSDHAYTIWGSILLFVCVMVNPLTCSALLQYHAHDPKRSEAMGLVWLRDKLNDLALLDVMVVGIYVGAMVAQSGNYLLAETIDPAYSYLTLAAILWHIHAQVCECVATEKESKLLEPNKS